MPLTLLNTVPDQPPITGKEARFTLTAPPNTDIYASPALGYHLSAPIAYKPLRTAEFGSVQATTSVPFTLPLSIPPPARSPSATAAAVAAGKNPTLQFDQGGVVFVFPRPSFPNPSRDAPGDAASHPRWIKAGIEVNEGRPCGSVVVRDRWSDWSLFDLPDSALAGATSDNVAATLTLQLERLGEALVIYVVDVDGEKRPVREVPYWFLADEIEETCWVGIFGARPDPSHLAKEGLEVRFRGFDIKDAHGKSLI